MDHDTMSGLFKNHVWYANFPSRSNFTANLNFLQQPDFLGTPDQAREGLKDVGRGSWQCQLEEAWTR